MTAACHFGFVVRMRGTTHNVFFVVFFTVQNLVRIGSVVLIISKFNDFCDLAGNSRFTLFLGVGAVFGRFYSLSGKYN